MRLSATSASAMRVRRGASAAAPFDIVILAGQSNMAGRGTINPAIDTTDPRVMQFDSVSASPTYRQIIVAQDMLKHPDYGSGVGPGMFFAKRYADLYGRRVLLVPSACGGTRATPSGAPWSPEGAGGSLLNAAISQAQLALAAAPAGSRIVGVLWLQGESDGDASVSQATYEAALTGIIGDFRASIGSDRWVIIGQMCPEVIASYPGYPAIDAAHQSVAASTAKAAFATVGTGYRKDAYHYTAEGARAMGTAMANAVAAAIANTGVTVPGQVTGLAAGSVTSSSVALSWTAPSSGGTPTDYVIEYSVSGTGSWSTFADGTGTTTSATVTGLTESTAYDFRVSASNAAGTGTASSTVTATTSAAVSYLRFATLTNYTESGTGPYTYTSSAGLNTAKAGGSNLRRAAGSTASFWAATSGTAYAALIGVTTSSGAAPDWQSFQYAIYANGAGTYSKAVSGVTAGLSTTAQAGDIVRLRFDSGRLYADVARAATPTTWIVAWDFGVIPDATYYPALTGTVYYGPVQHSGMV